jgi:hypothetical protein
LFLQCKQCKQFDAVVARVANVSVAEGDVGFLEGLAVRRDSGVLAQGYQISHCTIANGFIGEGPLQEPRGPPVSLARLLLQ